MRFSERLAVFLASGLGAGRLPFAPGTFGSLLAVPACYGISLLGGAASLAAAAVFVLPAVWIAGRAEAALGRKDAPTIVIDEVAGMLVTLAGVPFSPGAVVAGFVLFRAFDVLKPWPARLIERRLPGGWGVVLDDVAAGVYGNLTLQLGRVLLERAGG
ncbi:MAG: phosphatidylglycerophosphatase A [Desulfobacterales bacterium]